MKKSIGTIGLTLMAFGLMAYSASRTLNLLQLTLPDGSKELAWFALLGFDGGLVVWFSVFMWHARGGWQRGIALLMIAVCMAGVVVGFGVDTLYGAQVGGLINQLSKEATWQALLATIAIVALNIISVIVYHLQSIENQRARAAEDADNKIEEAMLKRMKDDADQIAAEMVPQLAEAWKVNARARYATMVKQIETRTDDRSADNQGLLASIEDMLAKARRTESKNGHRSAVSLAATGDKSDPKLSG